MAVFVFFMMAGVYLFAGLLARRYGKGLRLLLLGVSTLAPAGILLGWAAT